MTRKTLSRSKVSAATVGGSVARFRAVVDAYYAESFERFPIWGSSVGRHELDGEMGHASPSVWERQAKLTRRALEAVEDLPSQDFEADLMLDRRAFVANLRLALLELETLERWRNNPQLHLQAVASAIHDLIVRHGDDLAPVADALTARLRRVPRYLDEAAECLRRPDPLWQRLTREAAPGVAELFAALANPLAAALGRPKAAIEKLTREAGAAALEYAKRACALRPAPAGSFALGPDRFEALMRERLAVPWSPREAVAMARRWADELEDALRREARRFHPTRGAVQILADAARQWAPSIIGGGAAGGLLALYRKTQQAIRERFVESGWVGFPKGDRLLIQPVPAFMRDQFPTAAYNAPGALDPDQTGIFWVNDPADRPGIAPSRLRAETAQHFALELTCAHEAYPGHHLQFVHQNRLPGLARRLANHAVYYEGWTLWCEQMTADLLGQNADGGGSANGVDANPYLRLAQLHDALWRAWRVVIDVGLGCGTLDYDGACRLLTRHVGFTRARAEGDVNWYTAAPTVPMSYLIGKMELARLKRQRVDAGGMTLREFNDWALSFGAIPWRWIEESGL
jgi:uncharacterized protein (DUF885 family)